MHWVQQNSSFREAPHSDNKPTANLGPDISAPEIDWDAIAALVAAKEEAAKETAESEELAPPPFPNKTTTPVAESQASVLATQLRELADKIEAL